MQAWFLRMAHAMGLPAYKLVAPGRRGWPDVIVFAPRPDHPGKAYVMLVELKRRGEKLSKGQEIMNARLNPLIDVFVARGRAQAMELLTYAKSVSAAAYDPDHGAGTAR